MSLRAPHEEREETKAGTEQTIFVLDKSSTSERGKVEDVHKAGASGEMRRTSTAQVRYWLTAQAPQRHAGTNRAARDG